MIFSCNGTVDDGLKIMKQNRILRFAGAVLLATGLAGCSGLQLPGGTPPHKDRALADFKPILVRVTGYGTYPTDKRLTAASRHLMALRASKLDAYRALAERVYGTVIYGDSTVHDFVLHHDTFRTYVDSYIRGAKVISVDEHKDGVVETVMQLKLEPRFEACVSGVTERQVAEECPIPMPTGNDAAGDLQAKDHQLDSLYYLDP